MILNSLISLFKRGITEPEKLWQEECLKNCELTNFLKATALPVIVIISLLSTLMLLLFGYRMPFSNMVIHPTFAEAIGTFLSSILIFLLSIVLFGWLGAYIASLLGGKFDINKGAIMMFFISIPSLVGKIFTPLPFIGALIAIAASIYSLVLLYKAPVIFLNLPQQNRTKAFILFLLGSIVLSILLSITLGWLFTAATPTLPQN